MRNLNKRTVLKGFLTAGLLLGLGCSKTLSEDVRTTGFYASFTISGNNQNSASCTATFQLGGVTGTYLDLSSGDTVTCDGQSMARSEFAGIVTYSANVIYQVGKTYSVVLTRPSEGSYTSSVILPAQITGYSPSGGNSYQKGSLINVSWNPSLSMSDSMTVQLSYDTGTNSQAFYEYDTAPEAGAVGFGSGETQVSPPVPGNWTGYVRFTRYQTGAMASGLDGSIRAEQNVQASVTLTD